MSQGGGKKTGAMAFGPEARPLQKERKGGKDGEKKKIKKLISRGPQRTDP